MAEKPTYEELEQRILALKKSEFEKNRTTEVLRKSEVKYRYIVENVNDGITIAIKGKLFFVNSRLAEMMGFEIDELKGKDFFQFIPKDKLQQIAGIYKKRLSGEKVPQVYESGILHKNGRKIDVEFNTTTIQINDELATLTIIRDITERKQADKALQESEERLRIITENMADVVGTTDLELKTTYVSPSIEKLTGYSVSEYKKKEIEECYSVASIEKMGKILKEELEKENNPDIPKDRTRFLEVEVNCKNGIKTTEMIASFIRDNDGKPIGILSVERDITDRKRAEEALQKTHDELEQRVEERTEELLKIHDRLNKSKKRYRLLVENQTDMIVKFDTDNRLTFVSPSYCKTFDRTEEELLGKTFMPFIHEESRNVVSQAMEKASKPPHSSYVEGRFMTKGGWCWQAWLNTAILNEEDKAESIVSVGRDINKKKLAEEALRKSESELKNKTSDLEEFNAALKVLLNKRQEDKKELEDNILSNVRTLIKPYIVKLNKSDLPQSQKTLLNILESNLNEIVSPFTRKLSSKYLNLSPAEIRVANLVKQGLTNKDIAEILHVAGRTVAFHRENIRQKLDLTNKKTNLKTYLMSLD